MDLGLVITSRHLTYFLLTFLSLESCHLLLRPPWIMFREFPTILSYEIWKMPPLTSPTKAVWPPIMASKSLTPIIGTFLLKLDFRHILIYGLIGSKFPTGSTMDPLYSRIRLLEKKYIGSITNAFPSELFMPVVLELMVIFELLMTVLQNTRSHRF